MGKGWTTTPVTPHGRFGSPRLHPSRADPAYRARRQSLRESATGRQIGDIAPVVRCREVELRTWRSVSTALRWAQRSVLDIAAIANIAYQISGYQPVLYRANSLDQLTDALGAYGT